MRKATGKGLATLLWHRQAGFTLVELSVATLVSLIVVMAVLSLFDTASEVSRTQITVADLQQSVRVGLGEVIRMSRMAGRGGLPRSRPQPLAGLGPSVSVFDSPALSVRNNVGLAGVPDEVAIGFENAPRAVAGSDILTVRGVLTGPLYHLPTGAGVSTLVLRGASGEVTDDPTVATHGSITIADPGPSGIPQRLQPLADAIARGAAEALLLVSSVQDESYAVVELAAGSSVDRPSRPTVANLHFTVVGGTHTAGYRRLMRPVGGANLPPNLTSVAYAGVLEEYRFYARARRVVAGDDSSRLEPVLSHARMIPGSEIPYRGMASEARLDLADGFLSLQVAMGFDTDLGGVATDRTGDGVVNGDDAILVESSDGSADDWLFNGTSDDPASSDQPWRSPWDDDPNTSTPRRPLLQLLRLNVLVRAEKPDRGYLAPEIVRLEDLPFGDPPMDGWNAADERRYRRRVLEAVIDLRNL